MNGNGGGTKRSVSIVLFALYGCVLVYFLFFSENMGRTDAGRDYAYNLVPFREICRFAANADTLGAKTVWVNLAGNVAAFIPFGIFIIPVSGKKLGFAAAALLTFDVSLCVEIIQLLTRVGAFDVDDLILNTVGGVTGILIYRLFTVIERDRANGKAQI